MDNIDKEVFVERNLDEKTQEALQKAAEMVEKMKAKNMFTDSRDVALFKIDSLTVFFCMLFDDLAPSKIRELLNTLENTTPGALVLDTFALERCRSIIDKLKNTQVDAIIK